MGNNNSSSQQHAVSQHDMGRGWTQSFPRELTRHQNYTQQSPGHKVLPEPPNHRLRATNNGSIIHNGGTISGRKLAALTLPHDLNKQGNYRSRSTSASNIGVSSSSRCTSRIDDNNNNNQNYCNGNYRSCNCNYHRNEMMEIKKFGSEPDLRYSPSEPQRHSDTRNSGYYPERESRYRGKKKYKAPPPPSPAVINGDGSSPDSYKWEICGQEQRENCHDGDDNIHVQPPPRKSRLFKTRAETKRQANNNSNNNNSNNNNNNNNSCNINNNKNNKNNNKNNNNSSQQESNNILDRERRWRSENRVSSGKENRQVWREYNDQDRWSKSEKAKLKKFDGKNTLQRSLSSPEFQAELIQVAKKVRNKINYNDKRIGPIGAVSSTNISDNNIDIINDERLLKTRKSRNTIIEPFENRREEIRNSAKFYKVKKYQEERNNSKDINKHNNGIKKTLMNGNIRSKTAEPIIRIKKNIDEIGRTRSESPVIRQPRDRIDMKLDRMDVRGQGSGRESTPEPPRNKEKKNSDSRRKRNDLKNENYKVNEKKKWSGVVCNEEKKHIKNTEKNIIRHESLDIVEENWNFTNGLSSNANRIRGNLPSQEDEDKIQNEDIALKLRPTLPKKQLEIPRFSPSAAWRLLSALETPGPTMSTASEELPVMYEERIERLSRPPPAAVAAAAALVALDPRNSGDSGISGDAGAPNDDSIDASTNHLKSQTPRPTWTPQQDLGEESSSDAGVDSPPPMPPLTKFSSRPHVFSLSLPREDNRHSMHTLDKPNKDIGSFNSLQKIKKSVSGVFGLTSNDFEKKKNTDKVLDDNWLLSTSAPTSLQHSHVNKFNNHDNSDNLPSWDNNYTIDNYYNGNDSFGKNEFSMTSMKPPSFSYLASGGHVMYLPSSSSNMNNNDNKMKNLNYHYNTEIEVVNNKKNNKKSGQNKLRKKGNELIDNNNNFNVNYNNSNNKNEIGIYRERSFIDIGKKNKKDGFNFSKSCENISEMKQRSYSPINIPENLQDKKSDNININNTKIKSNSKNKRFTFQSTVRQIERKRLSDKLSREAEAKEKQRKNELEAMRKVEEEFQRKRAKEKANIRQQLRLYSMDEMHSNSLPSIFDNTNLSRADPDGAPSSAASSPTSASPGKISNNNNNHNSNRKSSASSDEYHKKKEEKYRIQQQQIHQQQPREYKDYNRPKYFDWGPNNNDSSSHFDVKQTTVHPKVVCDIPKTSNVFIDTNSHAGKNGNLNSTPRSDNYRKDFAHGAVAARSSLASSDSELSQPNTRPQSRQNGNKNTKPVRTRDETIERDEAQQGISTMRPISPTQSFEVASSEEEAPVEPVKQERNNVNITNGFILNAVQPFVREKSYRPISFNPQPTTTVLS